MSRQPNRVAGSVDPGLKEGFANRAQYARSLVEDNGGTLDAFYFAYGDDDLFAIIDVPRSRWLSRRHLQ